MNEKYTTVYKLLDETDKPGQLLSWGVAGAHEVEYKRFEVTRHPNMFVFDTIEHAGDYLGSTMGRIWEARTLTAKPAPERMLWSHRVDMFGDDFWNAWSTNPRSGKFKASYGPARDGAGWWSYTEETPYGTLLCDDLLLIGPVEEVEQ